MPRGVKKVEEIKEEIQVVEEAAQPAEEVAPVAEEANEAEVVAEEVPAAEEVKEEVQAVEEVPAEPVVEEVEEEVKDEPKKEAEKDGKEAEWKPVENLRIYPSLADLRRIKIYTGNIKVIEKTGKMTKIQYFKHSFGVIEGYTDQI